MLVARVKRLFPERGVPQDEPDGLVPVGGEGVIKYASSHGRPVPTSIIPGNDMLDDRKYGILAQPLFQLRSRDRTGFPIQ